MLIHKNQNVWTGWNISLKETVVFIFTPRIFISVNLWLKIFSNPQIWWHKLAHAIKLMMHWCLHRVLLLHCRFLVCRLTANHKILHQYVSADIYLGSLTPSHSANGRLQQHRKWTTRRMIPIFQGRCQSCVCVNDECVQGRKRKSSPGRFGTVEKVTPPGCRFQSREGQWLTAESTNCLRRIFFFFFLTV